MTTIRTNLATITLLLVAAFVLTGCNKRPPEKYGKPITVQTKTPVKTVLATPETFIDQDVVIEGKITTVCPSGCWFDVESEGLELHVDIKPNGFVIPQKAGAKATVQGRARIRDNQVDFVGTGVIIQ